MSRRPVRIEDLLDFRIPSDVQLVPGRDSVLWVERSVDAELGKRVAGLQCMKMGETARSLVSGAWAVSAPRPSPDGQSVAFLRTAVREAKDPTPTELCVMPLSGGGEIRVLASELGSFGAPAWSPHGHELVIALRRDDQPGPGEKTILSIRVNRLHYKDDGAGYLPRDRFRLYRVDLRHARPGLAPVFDPELHGDWDDREPTFSPDGKYIAFLSSRRPDRDLDVENQDVFVVPAEGGEARQCTYERGVRAAPAWSPDSRWLAVAACPGPLGVVLSRANMQLFRVWADGVRHEENLTPELDRCVVNLTIDDVWGLEYMMGAPAFSRDGRTVYMPVTDQGTTWLGALELDEHGTPLGTVAPVIRDRSVICFSVADRIAAITTTPTEPGRIELCDGKGEGREVIAWPMASYCEEVELLVPEEFRIRTRDDNEVQGWLLLPRSTSPGQRFPLLLYIHGGPVVQYGRAFLHEHQTYAARGYAVLYANPRGSQGYGAGFSGAIYRDWGGPPFTDLMAAVDYVIETYPIDPERMGVLGGSYGGYMTNWIVAHTRRFKAACSQRTVSSMEAMIWSDYGALWEHELGASCWDDPELYRRLSPITYVRQIQTPMLITQGLGDHRTPPDQGERLYVALRTLGKEAEMVLFPGGTHDLSRNGPPRQRIERLRCIHEWFDRYLHPSG